MNSKKSFTLVELMIVIAILAILSAIVIFTLNPSRLFDNFRDTRRVTDISSIHKAINFMESWNESVINYGNSNTLYISLPDTSSTCSSYTLPTLPSGYIYSCKPTSTYKNTDSTGWIPIDFTVTNSNSYLSSLPTDPVNDTTYFYSYYPGGSYEVTALLKNPNTNSINDSDSLTGAFTLGSPNRTWSAPLSRDTNLVGHWKFDEGSGTIAYDSSGNGYDGNIYNAIYELVNNDNYSLKFSLNPSEREYVYKWKAVSNNNEVSSVAWIKPYTSPTERFTILFVDSYYFSVASNNSLQCYWYGRNPEGYFSSGVSTLVLNEWNFVANTWDTSSLQLYVNDSIKLNTANTSKGGNINSQTIGAQSISRQFNGEIDDVRFYNRALSADEISQIYNTTKNKYQ